ncbi:MAG TPA: FAD-dependent thymidylate synthase [Candidatus Limnocylindrales bacterium]|nr:FAD-dependent thymidylate synthase [Candidatus Limnocylindrales bacterium]
MTETLDRPEPGGATTGGDGTGAAGSNGSDRASPGATGETALATSTGADGPPGRAPGPTPTAPAGATPGPTSERSGIPRNPGRHDLGLKATLLFPTKEIVERYYVPLVYTACRTCYSELEPDEIFRRAVEGEVAPEKQRQLIERVIESGHGSTIEHIVFTFGISGVSRTLSHQLVRHRAGVAFDQQSQRYVKFKGPATMLPGSIAEADPELRRRYEEHVAGALELYGEMVEAGIPGEDARFVFPNATRTNLVMTANLRALIHMSGLRLCTMAQWEIRRLFQLIRHEVFKVSPFLGSFLAPKCVPLGYCDEFANRDGHCPIRPHKDVVLAAWAEKARAARDAGRELPVR